MNETVTPTATRTAVNYPRPNTDDEFENCIAGTAGKFFIRLDENGKPDRNFKDFVYTVAEPNGVYKEMFGYGNEADFIIKIRMMKRDKRQLVNKTVSGVTVKEYAFVPRHTWDGNRWLVSDEDGEHVLLLGDFEKKFKAES